MLKRLIDWLNGKPRLKDLPWDPAEPDLPPDDVPLDQTTAPIHMEGDTTSF
jgi:hypothetical protein